jgi:hypothetical protein
MEHHSDLEKLEHHRRLIWTALEQAFPGCQIIAEPTDIELVLRVRDLQAPKVFSLQITNPVLVDSRPDSEIEDALPLAIELMRGNPGRVVFLHSRNGPVSSSLGEG